MKQALRILLGIATLSLGIHGSVASGAPALDLSRAWFEPSLTTNNDPVCAGVLARARKKFLSDAPWIEYSGGFGNVLSPESNQPGVLEPIQLGALDTEPVWEVDTGRGGRVARFRDNIVVTSADTRLYLQFLSKWDCGGACESQRLVVSDRALPFSLPEVPTQDLPFVSTPVSSSWSIYKGPRESYYAVGIVERQMQVYRVTHPREWALSCEVSVEPINARESSDPSTQAVVRALDELEGAVQGLARGAGNCGSLGTARRWVRDVHESLTQSLFRPWAIREVQAAQQAITATVTTIETLSI